MEDIPSGESWACRFKTTTFIDKESRLAVQDKNLAVGQAHRGHSGRLRQASGLSRLEIVDTNSIVQLLRHCHRVLPLKLTV